MTSLIELAAVAEELCDPHQHVEMIVDRDPADRRKRRRRAWVTTQDGLLRQLAETTQSSVDASETGGGRSAWGSRPPGSWEALSTHASITIYTIRWCWDLRLDQRDTVEANIRALVGHAPTLDSDTAARLLADMRSWRHQAAVATGWATPSYAPAVPCPVVECAGFGTLRINLDRMVALCRSCRSTWDDEYGAIRILAELIARATGVRDQVSKPVRSGAQGNGGWTNSHALAG